MDAQPATVPSAQDMKRQRGVALLRTEAAACLRQLAPLLGDGPGCREEMRPGLIRLLLQDLRGGGSGTPGSCSSIAGTAKKPAAAASGGGPQPCTPAGRAATPSMSGLQVNNADLQCCPTLACCATCGSAPAS